MRFLVPGLVPGLVGLVAGSGLKFLIRSHLADDDDVVSFFAVLATVSRNRCVCGRAQFLANVSNICDPPSGPQPGGGPNPEIRETFLKIGPWRKIAQDILTGIRGVG